MGLQAAIAYDGSPSARAAVRAAAALFPAADARVVTVPRRVAMRPETIGLAVPTISPTVVQETLDELAKEAHEQAAATAEEGAELARANDLDATVAPASAQASVWASLLDTAHDLRADVLVCGTRGRGGFARALLGSTSTSLLHHADLPLLAVPDGAGRLDGPAVIGYDGSGPSKEAIAVAGRLLSDRTTYVVHAWESQFRHGLPAHAFADGPIDGLREIVHVLDEALADDAHATTHQGVDLAKAAGLDATGEALESAAGAWRTVASAARTREAAVVVTGSRGLGGAHSALLGSVSSGLIHNAELPVLVVPAAASTA